MTPISFKANFVKNANIQQVLTPDKSKDKKVAIVELDRNNIFDKIAMRHTAIRWENPENNYAFGVANDMVRWTHNENETDHYIAITKQKTTQM